jgi:2-keto-4-pentenoate hydratase/2-oxohepta-3-ene-1,7-dioic acid hydratase in catechol pathway
MIVAQFADRSGLHVGIRQGKDWLDYGKAEAAMAALEGDSPRGPTSTIEELILEDRFRADEFRRMLEFIDRHRLRRHLTMAAGSKMLAPLRRPRKIVALGLNYALHAEEGNYDVPEEPIIFMKAGSSVIGPGETVRIPRGMGRMDHEVELAVVIGATAREVKKKNAWRHVAGYTICNDVTARDVQAGDLDKKHPWFRSKSFDTFTPLGPWIVTADEFPPPVQLDCECRVNGRVRQRANTRDLVFNIPEIIEFVSRLITLDPTDVISTGTPGGIGPITSGDTMVCRIEGIGELRNPVRWR